jgi:tRNA pseudouridine55 synthase
VVKASGPTSHDVVDAARRALKERRIGHTGTLDPMAEGLLLLCVGHATRLQQFLLGWPKTYRGVVRLGFSTTTYDREGDRREPADDPPAIDAATLDRLTATFSGTFDQLPPPYSAKKVDGKKLYELARRGQHVDIEPKRVTVHSLSLRSERPDEIDLTVTASTGFYVRSLAHDMGSELGCGGYLHHLERISIGPFDIAEALPQERLERAGSPAEIIESDAWIPLGRAPLPYADVAVNPTAVDRFSHGQEIVVFRTGDDVIESGDQVVVRSTDGELIGIGTVSAVLARGRTLNIHPSMVLATQFHRQPTARP